VRLSIPGRDSYEIEHVVLDMNGTVALDGTLIEGVGDRIGRLARSLHVVVVTADTHGGASRLGEQLDIEIVVLEHGGEAEQKADYVRGLGPERTITIGNGSNDALMLAESAVGICVVGIEGASTSAVAAADILATDILHALDLVLNPRRLVATLRS
jgi:P-type E1-E2 ATPase